MENADTTEVPSLRDALSEHYDAQVEPDKEPDTVAQETEPTEPAADAAPVEDEPEKVFDAPQHWPAERRELFSKLDDGTKEMVLGMSKDMESGLSRKMEELAEQRKRYEGFDSLLDSQATLYGVDRRQFETGLQTALPQLLQTYAKLQRDPVGTLRELADAFNVNDKLSEALLGQDNDESARLKRQQERQLAEENARLKSEQIRTQQERANQAIEQFKSQTGPDGKPLYPYFDELQSEMASLIRVNPSLTLEQAYRKAERSEKFDDLMKRERERILQEAEAERRKKAASARKVTKPTIGRSSGTGTAAQAKSLRDELASNWDQQANR